MGTQLSGNAHATVTDVNCAHGNKFTSEMAVALRTRRGARPNSIVAGVRACRLQRSETRTVGSKILEDIPIVSDETTSALRWSVSRFPKSNKTPRQNFPPECGSGKGNLPLRATNFGEKVWRVRPRHWWTERVQWNEMKEDLRSDFVRHPVFSVFISFPVVKDEEVVPELEPELWHLGLPHTHASVWSPCRQRWQRRKSRYVVEVRSHYQGRGETRMLIAGTAAALKLGVKGVVPLPGV
ncbi:hypothetical protein C8R43DRAFT_964679 [Mycena crocata]|nr:hypothetical protein C8R43DRAFT_964679 [Mycena crocata]